MFELCLLWNRIPTVYPERVMYSVGTLGLVAAAGFLSRLSKVWIYLLTSATLLINLFGFGMFPPTYDRNMERIGRMLSGLGFLADGESVGSDLPPDKHCVMAVTAGSPHLFRHVLVSDEAPQIFLPYPDPPTRFLFKSKTAAEIILRSSTRYQGVELSDYFFISDQAAEIRQFRAELARFLKKPE